MQVSRPVQQDQMPPSKLLPLGHLVLGPDAPLQDQMPPFITQVCQAVLKRTFKLLKRSTDCDRQ